MSGFIVGLFVAAARRAARWPEPHRREATEALLSLPEECFESNRRVNLKLVPRGDHE